VSRSGFQSPARRPMLPERDVAAVRGERRGLGCPPPGSVVADRHQRHQPDAALRRHHIRGIRAPSSRLRPGARVHESRLPSEQAHRSKTSHRLCCRPVCIVRATREAGCPYAFQCQAAAAFGASSPPTGPSKRGRSAMDDSALAKRGQASRMIFSRLCSRGSSTARSAPSRRRCRRLPRR
jgi:hypothetical protein